MRTRCLPILLPPSYYRLEREAQAAERDPVQQARWILKQALLADEEPTDDRGASDRDAVPGRLPHRGQV